MKKTALEIKDNFTKEQKTNYFRLALLISGFSFDNKQTEIIWRTYEKLLHKGKDFSVNDCIEIRHSVKEQENQKEETNLNWDSHLTKK